VFKPDTVKAILSLKFRTSCVESTVLLEEVKVAELVKEFPAFDGTRKFLSEFTKSHH
jgi:hypothetical protein